MLIEELNKVLAPTSTYRKKAKAVKRLEEMTNAQNTGKLVYELRDKNVYPGKIVFDLTGAYTGTDFTPVNSLINEHRNMHSRIYNTKPNLVGYMRAYTGNGYRDINSTMIHSFFYKKSLKDAAEDNGKDWNYVRNLDNGLGEIFDEVDRNVVDFPQPVQLFRFAGFIALKVVNVDDYVDNLYKIKRGMVISNLTYVSTTYTNSNLSLAGFSPDSQFAGCVFVIKLKSTEGALYVGGYSSMPSENEIILDRRGYLRVEDVKYEYVVEKCDFNRRDMFMERLVIYAEYIPHRKYSETIGGEEQQIENESEFMFCDWPKKKDLGSGVSVFGNVKGEEMMKIKEGTELVKLMNVGTVVAAATREKREGMVKIKTVMGDVYITKNTESEIVKMGGVKREIGFGKNMSKKKWMMIIGVAVLVVLVIVIIIGLVVYFSTKEEMKNYKMDKRNVENIGCRYG